MSGRKVADRPDPEWVATLKEGDRVAVAEGGHEVFESVVRRISPHGILRVGISTYAGRNDALAGYGRGNPARYLVPVASSPDSEGGA